MKGSRLSLELDVFGVLANQLPPNCEVLARHYNGDLCFGLLREPHNRELFLVSPWGFWKLDIAQLVTTFGDQVAEWKRGDDVSHGKGLTGLFQKTLTRKMLPPAWVQLLDGVQSTRPRRRATRKRA